MAKAGFWLRGARGKFNGASLKGQIGGGTQMAAIPVTVSNPNTALQVKTRSKFKLMSQLSANMADVIAIPREGTKSPRNLFFAVNSDKAMYTNGVAQISLENVQLTKSAVGLPQLVLTRNAAGAEANLHVELANNADAIASRVCYVIMRKNSEGSLELVAAPIVPIDDDNKKAAIDYKAVDLAGENIIVYGYGMRDLSSAAAVKYGELGIEASTDVARLLVEKTLSTSDFKFTQTRGASLYAGETVIPSTAPDEVRVFATALGNGTVTGGGTYKIGAQVTLTATAAEGSQFRGWRTNGTTGYVSQANPYTFAAPAQTVDLVAEFYTPTPDPDDSGVIS